MTIVDQLNNDRSAFQEFDMGQFEDEEKQFMYIDVQTKKVYDMRNDNHLLKLQESEQSTLISLDIQKNKRISINDLQQNSAHLKDWWKKKKRNNQDMLFAAEYGELEEVKRLLDKDGPLQDLVADINARGLDSWTALHFAANEGKLEIVNFLLSQPEIDIEAASTIGRTPLHLAAIRGHMPIVRSLINKQANKNVKDFDENTPLHYASEFGHFEVIIFLIKEVYADATLKNKFGYAPSDIAQNFKIRQLFESLLPSLRGSQKEEESKSVYGRTAFGGVLLHNDRINSVQKLMRTYQNVNKMMQQRP